MKPSMQDYEAAGSFLPQHWRGKVLNATFQPYFLGDGSVAYQKEEPAGTGKDHRFMVVDGQTGRQQSLFDHAKLASLLAEALGKPQQAGQLALKPLSRQGGELRFELEGAVYRFDGQALSLERPATPGVSFPPKGGQGVCVREGNLYLQDGTALTTDGTPDFGYGVRYQGDNTYIKDQLAGVIDPPVLCWSPDGRRFLTQRIDQRQVEKLHLVESTPKSGTMRPRLHSYHFALPGEPDVLGSIYIGDLDAGTVIPVQLPPAWPGYPSPNLAEVQRMGWSQEGNRALCFQMSPDFQRADVYEIDCKTGGARLLFTEQSDTFLFFDFHHLNALRDECADPEAGRQFVCSEALDALYWLSERDGQFHIYEYDLTTDQVRRQLTQGDYCVRQVLRLDAEKKLLYFTAAGREVNTHPYHPYLYQIALDSGEITLLSRDKGNHNVRFSPDGAFFTDTVSSWDEPQATFLCRPDGEAVDLVCRADVSLLEQEGLCYPIPFVCKAADGQTDVLGMFVMPHGFEDGKKYPVIDYYYGGVQRSNMPQTFVEYLGCGMAPALARLGFVVVVIDGRGTPNRGKAYHDYCYRNLGDCAGMDDHEATLAQLCHTYEFLDGDRVGVWGHSGGGYATFRCMVKKPALYKVGVSTGGNHMQEIYSADWSQRYMGPFDPSLWDAQNGANDAANLQGKLLLMHGEIDDNVHPAATLRVADALIRANKDFDFLLLPGLHHSLKESPYYQKRVINYFVQHLMGAEPPAEVDFS